MFQRRHYVFLASVLRERLGFLDAGDYWRVALAFADALAQAEPRFDRERFLDLCWDRSNEERTYAYFSQVLSKERV